MPTFSWIDLVRNGSRKGFCLGSANRSLLKRDWTRSYTVPAAIHLNKACQLLLHKLYFIHLINLVLNGSLSLKVLVLCWSLS